MHRNLLQNAPRHVARSLSRTAAIAASVLTAVLLAACATPANHNAAPRAAAPAPKQDPIVLRDRHLAAADAAADQYRKCLYGHVARYVNLVPDAVRLADEAATECAPITERFRRERQAAVATYASVPEARREADDATSALQMDGLRVARARATELRALQ